MLVVVFFCTGLLPWAFFKKDGQKKLDNMTELEGQRS